MHPLTRPGVNLENLKTFIGNNAEKIIDRGSKPISFSLPALLFSFLWLAYRKAYLAAFIVLIVELGIQFLGFYGISSKIPGLPFHSAIGIIHLAVGLFGLRYYLNFASKKVAKINAETIDPAAKITLYHAQGRTSAASVFGFLILNIILSGSALFFKVGGVDAFQHITVHSETRQTENTQVTTVSVQNGNTSVHSVITTNTEVDTSKS
ncbi:MAG: hypothetical protein K0S29_47 [Gammaproteobacteria bacterium]|jgi:hypothetical protein|nr:hypothetical protein [Gammaproteobacteria bacterium]